MINLVFLNPTAQAIILTELFLLQISNLQLLLKRWSDK